MKNKLKKKYWVKGKSKYIENREELQDKPDFNISDDFKEEQRKTVEANKLRRLKKYEQI